MQGTEKTHVDLRWGTGYVGQIFQMLPGLMVSDSVCVSSYATE